MDVPTAPRSSTAPTSAQVPLMSSRISRYRQRIVVRRAHDGWVSLEERPGLIGLQLRRCSSTRLHRCRCNVTVAWFCRAVRFACRCRRKTSAFELALRRCRPRGGTVSRRSKNLRRPLPDALLAPLRLSVCIGTNLGDNRWYGCVGERRTGGAGRVRPFTAGLGPQQGKAAAPLKTA